MGQACYEIKFDERGSGIILTSPILDGPITKLINRTTTNRGYEPIVFDSSEARRQPKAYANKLTSMIEHVEHMLAIESA